MPGEVVAEGTVFVEGSGGIEKVMPSIKNVRSQINKTIGQTIEAQQRQAEQFVIR